MGKKYALIVGLWYPNNSNYPVNLNYREIDYLRSLETLTSLVTETPPYERHMSPTMEKIWIAVRAAFHKSHQPYERLESLRKAFEGQSQVEALALEELEVAIAAEALAFEEMEVAILAAIEKGRNKALALQKKEELEADRAVAADASRSDDERTGNEMT
ncbi:hypothetical protein MtrunA17_Chr8g0356531 [Medicago truncatula]|uniref:Uncharacterized protein n=1 Tax=Medicago truncatula TaxID=3880 RepID=A0A396GPG8_MEDTR|nr:hypothetical protein MtrunA17_Chr8g0356531 [Medicago truncatula]